MASRVQSRVPMEERESLLSTGRRLNQHEQTNAQEWGIDSPSSSRLRVVARRLSLDSNSVQVVVLVPASEGAPTPNNVMDLRTGPDDDDGSEYLPR